MDDTFAARVEGNRIIANVISELQRQIAEAQGKRDATRKACDMIIHCARATVHNPAPANITRLATAIDAYDRAFPDATSLVSAIAQALIADPRPALEVYADVVQGEARWRARWGALSEGERERVVAQARKEAGRE